MPHIHDKIDYTVEVFIVFRNKLLLRKHDKYGIWLSIGGHIELDEDPNEAAIREVQEEVGLKVILDDSLLPKTDPTPKALDLIPPYYLNRNRISDTHEHVTFVYFAKANTDVLKLSKSEKSDEVKWFTKEEIENADILEDIKFYALAALTKLTTNY